ncbi:flagellar type III secretion system pore protein FliP [Desulfurispira natronophila]|uniref:Flagellar biosynthetic protein FliP n=1 Tax=Desulfurispira natronophila TaxID=682562 RepID=A0A7W8DGX6_9BACT|nr:flagellar type III secretion system pore protein FliP [Desulfurispira natronophila]MBB5021693.1 flagellar biosynthetic protein FliP [Desulfurispira natronophila]
MMMENKSLVLPSWPFALRFLLSLGLLLFLAITASAQEQIPLPVITFGVDSSDNPSDIAVTLQIIFLITILTLAPSILMLMTSFVLILIVLSFLRQAMGTMQSPPNQVLVSLALFLTFYIMMPTFQQINENALQPYLSNDIGTEQALQNAADPLAEFMMKHTREKDLALFVHFSGAERPETREDISFFTLVPAFVISELKTAFQMGFMIFIPFLIIDMVVASTLMSMGMMMLPPAMISMPFKVILFVLVDGWNLVMSSLLRSFLER